MWHINNLPLWVLITLWMTSSGGRPALTGHLAFLREGAWQRNRCEHKSILSHLEVRCCSFSQEFHINNLHKRECKKHSRWYKWLSPFRCQVYRVNFAFMCLMSSIPPIVLSHLYHSYWSRRTVSGSGAAMRLFSLFLKW